MKINTMKIKICLAKKGMTQSNLADKMGVGRSHISTILTRGTCSAKTAGLLASSLGIPVEEIVAEVI